MLKITSIAAEKQHFVPVFSLWSDISCERKCGNACALVCRILICARAQDMRSNPRCFDRYRHKDVSQAACRASIRNQDMPLS